MANVEDLGDPALVAAAARFRNRRSAIERTMALISTGRGLQANSAERMELASERSNDLVRERAARAEALRSDLFLERQIGKTNDIVSTEFFEIGLLAQRAVGRIITNLPGGQAFGTGFLVGDEILMTNHHVISTPAEATDSGLELDAEFNRTGTPRAIQRYDFDPDRFFLTDKAHDLTLVAVTDYVGNRPKLSNFGWHVLDRRLGKILIGHPVNIIQHPSGKDKSVVVHNSNFLELGDRGEDDIYCWYSGDTEGGSSGSPVFNRNWEVIAIHHKAIPKTDRNGSLLDMNGRQISQEDARAHPDRVAYVANEGIRVSRAISAIERAALSPPMAQIRDGLIALWSSPRARDIAFAAIVP